MEKKMIEITLALDQNGGMHYGYTSHPDVVPTVAGTLILGLLQRAIFVMNAKNCGMTLPHELITEAPTLAPAK